MEKHYRTETRCVHGDYDPFEHLRSRNVPLYQSSAFCYDSTDHAARLFDLTDPGYVYMRLGNPTVDEAEKRVAMLEGGNGAVGFSSGMAAITGFILNFLKPGDEILASGYLYGGTSGLLRDTLPTLGISARFFDPMKPESLDSLIGPSTRLVMAENLANPRLIVPDVAGIAGICHSHGVPLAVDNTLATPFLSRPFEHGADFVLHSCTKYMDGHGSILGGMVVDSGNFQFDAARYPLLHEASPGGVSYTERFGKMAFIARLREKVLMNTGGSMAPFHAWLLIRGMESLHVRMERHCENAARIADYLNSHPKVAWVCYPGLKNHPSHENAVKYLGGYFGGMLGFGVKGGFEAGRHFIDHVGLLSHTTNIGDTKSLVIHPASTTHRNLSPEEREAAGITDDFIRFSVGIENADDLIAALEEAL